jgi:dATP pyrophosphohydrolase
MSKIGADYIQLHIVLKDENNYKFLVLQRNDKTKIYPNIWQVVTGTIEKGETAIQTALRELNEETGLTPTKMWTLPMLAQFYEKYSDTVQFSPTFCVLVESNQVQKSNEHISFEWLSNSECLNRLTLPSHKQGTNLLNEYLTDLEKFKNFEIKL